MLVKKINFNDFVDEFRNYGREDQYSYEGFKALFDYLEEISEDLREHIELDVLAICCDFTEYSSLEEFVDDYRHIEGINSIEDIAYYTTVIPINSNSFIIQNF